MYCVRRLGLEPRTPALLYREESNLLSHSPLKTVTIEFVLRRVFNLVIKVMCANQLCHRRIHYYLFDNFEFTHEHVIFLVRIKCRRYATVSRL